MKKLLIVLSVVLNSCGWIGKGCDDPSYKIDKWGICVYVDESGFFNQQDTTRALDLFFEGLDLYAGKDVTSILREEYLIHNTSLSFTNEPIKYNGLYYLGLAQRGTDTWDGTKEYTVTLFNNSEHIYNTVLSHEMLHTVQFVYGWFHENDPHGYPKDWFMEYDLKTGDYLPDQDPMTKLENILHYYIACNMITNAKYSKQCQEYGFAQE